MNKWKKGNLYETKAKEYLEKMNLEYLERNFHGKFGEIDLIFRNDKTLIFVEVKYRKDNTFGSAMEAVDQKKAKRIYFTAMDYLTRKNYNDLDIRFDLVSFDGEELKWTKNIIWGDNFEF